MLSRTLYKPLRAAFRASGMTLEQLRAKSGVKVSGPSLWRKLHGTQGIVIENGEAAKLGAALDLLLIVDETGARYERAA